MPYRNAATPGAVLLLGAIAGCGKQASPGTDASVQQPADTTTADASTALPVPSSTVAPAPPAVAVLEEAEAAKACAVLQTNKAVATAFAKWRDHVCKGDPKLVETCKALGQGACSEQAACKVRMAYQGPGMEDFVFVACDPVSRLQIARAVERYAACASNGGTWRQAPAADVSTGKCASKGTQPL